MKEIIVKCRNFLIWSLYQLIFKPIAFSIDPEKIHDHFLKIGQALGRYSITRSITGWFFRYSHPALEQNIFGIKFKNPIGLAAGFDKDGLIFNILPSVGFGYEEIGSITGEACDGNPKPRLWRLKKSKGLAVYYGLKNRGAEEISSRLKNAKFRFPVGTSIAKTNNSTTVEAQAGIADYVKGVKNFTSIGDYFAINISCPNAYGGEPFGEPIKLEKLLTEIDKIETRKPIFLKMPADISEPEIDALLEVIKKHRVHGLILTNLTKKRDNPKIKDSIIPEKGGLSGKIVQDISDRVIAYVYKKTSGKYVIIGTGGVFTAEDAYKKIKAGASLVQIITGMIFEGPQVISEINLGLVKILKKDGYSNIHEAIGQANKT